MGRYIICCIYIVGNTTHSAIIRRETNGIYDVKTSENEFYNDVFCNDKNYYLLSRYNSDLILYKYDKNDVISSLFKIPIILSNFSINNRLFYGNTIGNNVYIAYNDFICEIPRSIVLMFDSKLNIIWNIVIDNAMVGISGNSVAVSENNLYISIEPWNTPTFNKIPLEGNFLTFSLEFPKLIGICVNNNGNLPTINFRDPSCFKDLLPGTQYYINEEGKITTNTLYSRYLGTSISNTTMLIN